MDRVDSDTEQLLLSSSLHNGPSTHAPRKRNILDFSSITKIDITNWTYTTGSM